MFVGEKMIGVEASSGTGHRFQNEFPWKNEPVSLIKLFLQESTFSISAAGGFFFQYLKAVEGWYLFKYFKSKLRNDVDSFISFPVVK